MDVARIGLSAALTFGIAVVAAPPLVTADQSAPPSAPPNKTWGGLLWSAPTPGPDGFVRTIIPVGGALVAVGAVQGEDRTSAAAWRSEDGVTWEQTLLDGAPDADAQAAFVVPIPAGLLALGSAGPRCTAEGEGERCPPPPDATWTSVAMWRSVDGSAWTRVPTPPVFAGANVSGVASGPGGLVAIGSRGFAHPRLWTSTDGTSWQRQHLPSKVFRRAQLMDLAAVPGGWVIVGASGGTPPIPGGVSSPNGSTGAAWSSADGQTWTSAHVAGRGPQVELRDLYRGSDGSLVIGTREGGHTVTRWTPKTADGWILARNTIGGTFQPVPIAADGQRIIGESYVEGDRYSFSVSSDGTTWRTLANLGATATMPRWPGASGAAFVDSAFVLPDAILFLGADDDGATIVWRTTALAADQIPPSPSRSPG